MGELRINLTNFLTVTLMAFVGLTLVKKLTGLAATKTGV